MRFKALGTFILIALMLCLGGAFALAAGADTAPDLSARAVTPEVQAQLASVQVPFVENQGQIQDANVKFYANTFAGTVFVTGGGITYALPGQNEQGWVLQESFAGAKAMVARGIDLSGAEVNIFKGKDSSAWKSGLPAYDEITLGEVYDRVQVNMKVHGNNVEKIFIVSPGGDPGRIAMAVSGAGTLKIDDQGHLELVTGLGAVTFSKPAAYQLIDGARKDVAVAYVLKGEGYGFTVGTYDSAYPLVIDPLLASTFLGGSGTETGYNIDLDKYGYVYVAGTTKSVDFPGLISGFGNQQIDTANGDVFVAKLSPDLTQLLVATYLGGSYNESFSSGSCLAVAPSGEVYLAGYTKSTDFPTPGGYDHTFNDTSNNSDVFIARLSGDLSELESATFLGGIDDDRPSAIALDGSGYVFVAGLTKMSSNLPTTAGAYQKTHKETTTINDGFISKLSPDLSNLLASTYLGGSSTTNIYCISPDSDGNIYVAGNTGYGSSNLPTTTDAYNTVKSTKATMQGFVSKLDNNLANLLASTYFGTGYSGENIYSLAIGSEAGNVVVYAGGYTADTDFPGTDGVYQKTINSSNEMFIAKLNSGLTQRIAMTYLGTSVADTLRKIILDSAGNLYIEGTSSSPNSYPCSTGAYSTARNGASGSDIVITRMKGDLTRTNGDPSGLLASTYFGGVGSDIPYDMALDAWGNVYLTGAPATGGFPLVNACQGTLNGTNDAFVAKFTGDLTGGDFNNYVLSDTTAPVWVDGGSLTVSNVTYSGLTLTWTPASDNVGVTGYRIYQDGAPAYTVSSATYTKADGTVYYNVTGLNDDQTYSFYVDAGDANNNWSPAGPTVNATTLAEPDTTPPNWTSGSLTTSDVTDTSVTLNWSGASDNLGVTGYLILDSGAGSVVATVYNGTVYSYTVTSLTPSIPYTFRVQAFDTAGNLSVDGPQVGITTAAYVDRMSPVFSTGATLPYPIVTSSSSLILNWPAATDNVEVTKYRISTNGIAPIIVGGNTLSYEITGLDSMIGYDFSVEAGDAAGNWSSPKSTGSVQIGTGGFYMSGAYLATISGNLAFSSHDAASIDGSGSVPLKSTFVLTFTKNIITDNVWANNKQCFTLQTASGVNTGQNVQINVNRIPDTINNGAEKQNIFITPASELTPNTQYKLNISSNLYAKNGDQMGYNRELTFTTAASGSSAPSWPNGATLTTPAVADTFVTLNWPSASSSANIAGYIVFENGDIVAATNGPANSLNVTGLTLSTQYTFKVEAFDIVGNWTTSGPSTTVTTAATAPKGIPIWSAGQVATVSYTTDAHDRLNLSWPAATDDHGIQNYRISKNDTVLDTVSDTTLSYNVTGLTEANWYNFKIEALNLANNWSITNLLANAYSGGGAWTGGGGQSTAPFMLLNAYQTTATSGSVSSDTGATIAGSSNVPVDATFKLIFSKNAIASWSTANKDCFRMLDGSGASVPIDPFIINIDAEKDNIFIDPVSPLNPDSAYKIVIGANLKANSGATLGSDVVICFTTAGGTDTTAPTWAGSSALTASNVTQTGLTLTWSGASDNVAVTGYKVYIYQGNDMTTPLNSVDVAGTTYDVTGLTAGTAYTFKVEAGDTAGNWSENGPVKAVLTSTNDTTGSVPVTFPSDVTNPAVSVGAFVSTSGSVTSGKLPGLDITANTTLNSNPVQLQVTIPAGVTVTANVSDWDGDIHAPTVQANSSITLSNATVNAVIEIGYGDVPLTFDQPVRILIPGQAGKSVGYVRNGIFTAITNHLNSDSGSALLDPNVDGWINSINNSDLVIWTKHFTQFVTYAPTGDSGGPSGGDIKAPTWPDNNFITAEKDPQTQIVTLVWHPATDNVGVTKYRIYHGTEQIDEVDGNTTNFTYTQPTGAGTGSLPYSVQAGDAAGNWSTDGPSKTLGGSNLPLIVEYGVYSYNPSSNTTPPTPIGSVLTSGTLTGVPTTFSCNTAIGIKFVTNVAGNLSSNKDVFQLLDASGSSIDIRVDRSGDGTSQDDNRNYLFVIPQVALKPGSSYRIIIGPTLTSNNGMSAGVQQEVNFTTEETVTSNGPTITTGSGSVDPSVGATVSLGDDAKVVIPANALKGTSSVTVDVKQVTSPPAAPSGFRIAGKVYEFTVDGQSTYNFDSNVAITLGFDPSAIGPDETVAVYYYDQSKQQWVSLGGTVAGSTITVQVEHFTKFAVFAVKEASVPVVAPGTLTDITGHWAEANIRKLVELGAVSGYEDGTFKPDSTITRAEFATILVNSFKYDISTTKLFSDTADHWARDYVSTAAVFGIAGGYEDGSFRPDDPITREQMAVMVVKAAKLELVKEEAKFADGAGISGWAKSAVATAVKNGLMKGYPDNTFQPQGNAKRAEAVTVIINALNFKQVTNQTDVTAESE